MAPEQTNQLAALRAKLDDGTITVQELREFCTLNFPPREGMQLTPAYKFIPDDTLQAFTWLFNWWTLPEYPRDLPKPNLLAFLWNIYTPVDAAPASITDKFMEFVQKGRAYCEANGFNPDQPTTDPEEARKARNRTRMARARAARKVPERELRTPEIRAQVRELEAQIQRLKEQAKAVDIVHRDDVLKYQQLMVEAASQRKLASQQHREAIDALRNQISNLTQ